MTRAIVTGANSGIGFHTAVGLARRGFAVTLACRDLDRGGAAADRVRALAPGSSVEVRELNLSSLASVQRFAESWQGALDLLVNNAGVMAPRRWTSTPDGFELQFGTNHLAHYALTGRLLPALLEAAEPRVVTVSSLAHRSGTPGVLLGNPEPGYRGQQAYSESKLANLLFALELQRRARAHGSRLVSTAAHPGISATNLYLTGEGMGANPIIRILGRPFGVIAFQSARAGAEPTLLAADSAAPGSYSGPRWLGEIRGPAGPARLSRTAQDTELAAQLWELSATLTGVDYRWSA